MSERNIFRKIIIVIFKLILVLISAYIGFIFLVIFSLVAFSLLGSIFLTSPNLEEAKKSVRTISHYNLPKSFKLEHSKAEFWGSNMCFVFSYPEGYYTITNSKYNYLNQKTDYNNEDFEYHFRNEVSKNQGCHKFVFKLDENYISLFKEYDRYSEYGRGSKIFINNRDNLIMFEGYLYD